jgi:hypothetical protein
MKKLIAIAVVFALAASFAFAETTIGGNITTRGRLLSDTLNDTENTAVINGEVETAYIQLSGTNDEGTFGGLIRMRGNDGRLLFHRAFAWWKPIPQLQIFFGQDPDGKFGPYNAWSFFQGEESYANVHVWGAWRAAFPGNWDTFGLAFSLYPADGLEVNLVVPFGGIGANKGNGSGAINSWDPNYTNQNFQDIFGGSLQLTASYAIPQIGKAFFTLLGPGSNIFADYTEITGEEKVDNYGRLGVGFLLTAVEGLDVQLGFSTTLPGAGEDFPTFLALIANYTGGEFGVRFRSRLVLSGTVTDNGEAYVKDGTELGFDVQPWYNFGAFTAYLSIGMVSTKGTTGDPVNQFILNPYIKASFGAGNIRLGVIFHDPNLDNDNDAKISIPLVFGFNF